MDSSQRPTTHGSVSQHSSTPVSIRGRNLAGCDMMIDSCGPNGGCCDEHDDCYEINKCTAFSWVAGVPGTACSNCNWNVMKCAVTRNPGMSSCCSDNTCGQDETQLER